jgi:plastocyanin
MTSRSTCLERPYFRGLCAVALAIGAGLAACGDSSKPKAKETAAKPAETAPAKNVGEASAPTTDKGTAYGETVKPDSTSSSSSAGTSTPPADSKDGIRVQFSANGGRAVFVGKKPEQGVLAITAEASKGCDHSGQGVDTADPRIQIAADGSVANVVIEVSVSGDKAEVPAEPIAIDQAQCRFEPHVSVVPTGAEVVFKNSDQVNHNVNTYPIKSDKMNDTIEAGGKRVRKFDENDRIEVKCDIHPWMNSWIIVSDAPVVAVSDAQGRFQLPGLPAGTHDVDCWHEALGSGSGKLTVAADGTIAAVEINLGKKARR